MEHGQNNILVVDDVESSRSLLAQILTREGYKVITASSSHDALVSCQTEAIDLCILDIDMPAMNGFELAEILRTDVYTQHIYLIFLTGVYDSRSHMLKGFQLGAIDYIAKPLDREILINKIKIYCGLINRDKSLLRENNFLKTKINYNAVHQQAVTLKSHSALVGEQSAENTVFPLGGGNEYLNSRIRRTVSSELRVRSQEKSQFLSLVNHELRTPLQSIIGFSQLLLLDTGLFSSLNDDQKDSVQHIYKSGHQLLEQIDLLLELSQLKSGDLELEFEKVDVGEVLTDLSPVMEELTNMHNITVKIEERAGLCVYANHKKVKQLLKHLLTKIYSLDHIQESIYFTFEYLLDTQFLRIMISEKEDGLILSRTSVSTLVNDEFRDGSICFDIIQCLTQKMAGRFGFEIKPDIGSFFWVDLPVFNVD